MLRTRIHRTPRTWIISAMLLAVPCLAIAQEAAAPATPAAGSRAIPRPDELEPGVNTTPAVPAAPAAPAAAAPTAAPAAAPKVLYIVPWKRADLGDVVGKPVNSLLDEVLQPLDRDVFKRENRYYDDLKLGAGDAKAGAAQGSETKP